MAKQELPVDFKDDVLQAEMAGKRKYRIIQNEDGTISLEDVTNYSQIGSNFGAAQMNATNLAVNESFDKNKVIDSLADIVVNEATGYAAGALAVRELNGKLTYSSDEKQIGYTDKGEPVFRKIIYLDMTYFNKPSSGYSNLKFGAKVSFDDVFSIDSVIKQNSTGIEYQLPYSSNGSFCTWLNKISHNGSESVFEFHNNAEWGNDYTMAINIVYTKK